MADVVHELIATAAALEKLGARGIAIDELAQVLRNRHETVRNRRSATRRLLIGVTDGGRWLTLVIERMAEPTTWLVITGWSSTDAERNLVRRQ
jgi:hypothetical protein